MQEATSSAMENLVSFRPSPTSNSNMTAAAQARQTVLDAIAPMRRGRPTISTVSPPPIAPNQEKAPDVRKFEEQWNAVRTAKTNQAVDDAWNISDGKAKANTMEGLGGFGDSFMDSSFVKPTSSLTASAPPIASKKVFDSNLSVPKDAFDGLGGIPRSRDPSPTLAEATNNPKSHDNTSARPTRLNGISRTPIPVPTSTPLSPRIPASRTGLATYHPPVPLSAEERFPSLDELDKGWRRSTMSHTYITPVSQPRAELKTVPLTQHVNEDHRLPPSGTKPSETRNLSIPPKGEARSQQVTGTAMRDGQAGTAPLNNAPRPSADILEPTDKQQLPIGSVPTKYRPSRPALARKHRSSVTIKPTDPQPAPQDWLTGDGGFSVKSPAESNPAMKQQWSDAVLSSPSKVDMSPDVSKATIFPSRDTEARMPEITIPYRQKRTSSPITADSGSELSAFKGPPVHAPRRENEELHRQDSSSDDAEGPEDVNGRVIDNDVKKGAKGRQSSVHDLVDLYGGSRSPVDRERTGPPSPVLGRKGKRTSGILVDLSLPPQSVSSAPNLLSPASIVPESRAELASRRSGSSSRGEHTSSSSPVHPVEFGERTSRPTSRASPGPPTTERSNKPRPQSMFLFPSKSSVASASNVRPSEGPRQRASLRRGSISDMVDLYENLGGRARSKNPPALASKPAGLKLSKTPSPITSRFPPISPSGVSFSPTQITSLFTGQQSKSKPKPRRSPTTGSFGDYESLEPALEAAKTQTKESFVSRVPRRQSVSPSKRTAGPSKAIPASTAPSKPFKPPSLSIPKTKTNPTLHSGPRTPVTEAPISSPSPERPYQGVGKLIDQWQKKTEEADASRRSGPRPAGRPIGPRGRRETGNVD